MVKLIGKKEVQGSINLTPLAVPTPAAGVIYFDSASSKIKVCEDGSTFTQTFNDLSPALSIQGLNLVRLLIAGSPPISKGGYDAWAEAYVAPSGRTGTDTDESKTTSYFSTNKYKYSGFAPAGTTTTDANGGTGAGNSTSYTITMTASSNGYFSFINAGYIWYGSNSYTVCSTSITVGAETLFTHSQGSLQRGNIYQYNTTLSQWTRLIKAGETVVITFSSSTGPYFYTGSGSYSGTDFSYTSQTRAGQSAGANIFTFKKYNPSSYDIITHNIASGTFSPTISSVYGIAHIADWETGASIQFKLTNATEDTGWLSNNNLNTFTAFTSQPTNLIVRLNPKSSSPTAGYPAIYGFFIKEM